jgi:DNA-binding response OmpR family regulator
MPRGSADRMRLVTRDSPVCNRAEILAFYCRHSVEPMSPRVVLVDVPPHDAERIVRFLDELGVSALSIEGSGELDARPVVVGDLRIDPGGQTAHLGDSELSLTAKEFGLILLLARHSGAFISRRELMRQVWKRSHEGRNRTVDIHIRRLRAKLGARGNAIETKVHVGYRLVPGRLEDHSNSG